MTRLGSRKVLRTDLLAFAQAEEIDWKHAAPVLRGWSVGGGAEFVYFIGERHDGPIKIGRAADPIKRLRGLQTGNPRRLRIERLIYGDLRTEKLLHEHLQQFVIGGTITSSQLNSSYARDTEWFRAEARSRILEVADAIWTRQESDETDLAETFETTAAIVLQELGFERRESDVVLELAETTGYVRRKLRRPT